MEMNRREFLVFPFLLPPLVLYHLVINSDFRRTTHFLPYLYPEEHIDILALIGAIYLDKWERTGLKYLYADVGISLVAEHRPEYHGNERDKEGAIE